MRIAEKELAPTSAGRPETQIIPDLAYYIKGRHASIYPQLQKVPAIVATFSSKVEQAHLQEELPLVPSQASS